MLGTVTKAGKVLDLFSVNQPEWGVAEVAAQLEIPKSSAHGLLATLTEIGLTRRASGGRYRLGWRIVELNRTLDHTTGLVASARPVLRQLADEFAATAEFGALRRDRVAILDCFISGSALGAIRRSPSVADAVGGSAIGKVLLANMQPVERDKFIDQMVCTGSTPVVRARWAELRADLTTVRMRGVAIDQEQTTLGLCSVAAPVRDAEGEVHTAIAVNLSALAFHRNRELLSRAVQRAAARISRDARAQREFGAAGE
jgi:DNA-binding IclR family transcriptional regulator